MISILYTTIDNQENAESIAYKALQEEIAACVNIIPQITSIYKWENKIVKSQEYILIFKTSKSNQKKLMEWIKKNHSYDVPAILAFEASTSQDFLAYIEGNIKAHG